MAAKQPLAIGKKKWFHEIDHLRGLGILAVIGIHVAGNYRKIGQTNALFYSNLALLTFLRFAVPLFVLISGFVLAQKYYERFDALSFYVKRLRVILIPYLIFSVIYLAAYGVLKGWPSPTEAAKRILTGNAAEHLWFFRLIIELYLVYPWLIAAYRGFEQNGRSLYFLALILTSQISINILVMRWAGTPGDHGIGYAALLLTFVQFWFYFVLGIFIARNFAASKAWVQKTLSSRAVFVVLAAALLTAVNTRLALSREDYAGLVFLTEPFLFASGFLLCYGAAERIKPASFLSKSLLEMGKYSYGIYLIHILFLWAIVRGMTVLSVDQTSFIFYPAAFVLTVLTSYTAVFLIHKTPASQMILGLAKE